MSFDSPIRIIVADYNAVDRNTISKAINQFAQTDVISRVNNLNDIPDKISSLKPDILILDLEIPGLRLGLFLPKLKNLHPELEIVLVSSKHRTSSESSLKALELGAMYFIKKPSRSNPGNHLEYYQKYFRPVINLYSVTRTARKVRASNLNGISTLAQTPEKLISDKQSKRLNNYKILAVGSSLGGPEALKKLIPGLPANFPLPVVITQHMPAGFTATLAETLDERSSLIVREARGAEIIRPGYAYLAPGGYHMLIKKCLLQNKTDYIIYLDNGPEIHGCRPSVDTMLNSLAESMAGNVLAVILTGMGEDGRDGVQNLKQAGKCLCVTQDEASSVVYGMPGSVYKAGLSDLSVSIDNMSAKVDELVRIKPAVISI